MMEILWNFFLKENSCRFGGEEEEEKELVTPIVYTILFFLSTNGEKKTTNFTHFCMKADECSHNS